MIDKRLRNHNPTHVSFVLEVSMSQMVKGHWTGGFPGSAEQDQTVRM